MARSGKQLAANKGFTLVELLVVITIIGILVVALVPIVKGAQARAKEAAVKTQCANIEASLANYAQNHNGNYPGVAIDPMAPWASHAVGDDTSYNGQQIYLRTPPGGYADNFDARPQFLVSGVLGGFGHDNIEYARGLGYPVMPNVLEQLKFVKDTPLDNATNRLPRYFDSLVATDAIQEFPPNPFVTSAQGERLRMTNIFRFWINLNTFVPGFTDNTTYGCAILVEPGTVPSGYTTEVDAITGRWLLQPPTVAPASFAPAGYDAVCPFGIGKNNNGANDDMFAPGDFAYVPVLTASSDPFTDAGASLENEYWRWGVNVSGYMMFGYGSKEHKGLDYEDDARKFLDEGLPGYGGPGVDTTYEDAVFELFQGAIYFSKKY